MRNEAGVVPKGRWLGMTVRGALHPVLVREVVVPLVFILAILTTNYALAALPNVKLFDLIVFVAGYSLGLRRGVTVAAGAWLLYGNFNPWGPTMPSLLATLMASETVYAVAGAVARRLLPPQRVRLGPGLATLLFATAALLSTAVYDVAANIYTGVSWAHFARSSDVTRWVWVALANPGALLFYVMHVGSNVAFFAALGPGMVRGVEKGRDVSPWGL